MTSIFFFLDLVNNKSKHIVIDALKHEQKYLASSQEILNLSISIWVKHKINLMQANCNINICVNKDMT